MRSLEAVGWAASGGPSWWTTLSNSILNPLTRDCDRDCDCDCTPHDAGAMRSIRVTGGERRVTPGEKAVRQTGRRIGGRQAGG